MNGEPKSEKPHWKEDFPIGWERDHYITRRELVKFLTLGSGLLVGANATMTAVGRLSKPPTIQERRIGLASAIPVGGSVLFRFPTDEDPCILVRNPDGRLAAFSQVCTHLSCAVVHRPREECFTCPCHHGIFACDDGRPVAGPPTRRLPRVILEVRDDEVFAVGMER